MGRKFYKLEHRKQHLKKFKNRKLQIKIMMINGFGLSTCLNCLTVNISTNKKELVEELQVFFCLREHLISNTYS